MSSRYFEDFKVGDRFASGQATFTEQAIIEFGTEFDPQPFHTDPDAAKQSLFGGLVASGVHSLAVTIRLTSDQDIFGDSLIAGLSFDGLTWPRPVRPGDTVTVDTEIIEARTSRSKPDCGIVRLALTTRNQQGQTVLTVTTTELVRRRPR